MIVTNIHPSSLISHPLFVIWNPSEVALRLGPLAIRWYSLCWLIGLVGAFFVVKWLYKDQKIKDELFDPLFIYCFLGILIGARLGHCLFYQPDYYLTSADHFIEMLIPMHKAADGSWHYTGYAGLASHGGTAGLILALWLYCRKTGIKLLHVMDNIAIATGFTACFIRLGNLMNSEIIGKPTDLPWAFVFEQVDNVPRHPGQLYEAIAYMVLFCIMLIIYKRREERGERREKSLTTDNGSISNKQGKSLSTLHSPLSTLHSPLSTLTPGSGFYFGLCLFYIFTYRFFIEYTKDIQVDFESGMLFNMGQLLSVPFIIVGALFMYRAIKR